MEKIWLKSYHNAVPAEINFEKIALSEALTETAERFPNNPALLFQGLPYSFKKLDDMVSRFASALVALGVNPGDKVALLLPNLVQMVAATYGAFRRARWWSSTIPCTPTESWSTSLMTPVSKFLVRLDFGAADDQFAAKDAIGKIVSCHIRDFLPFPLKQLFPFVKRAMHRKTPDTPDVFEFMDLMGKYQPITDPHKFEWETPRAALYRGNNRRIQRCSTNSRESFVKLPAR